MIKNTKYDIALSFAGKNREYVEQVAEYLRARGLKVFYDDYEKVDLWGKNLYSHLSSVYKNDAKYVVMFVSKQYANKVWTNLERESAQARAFTEKKNIFYPQDLTTPKFPDCSRPLDTLI